LLLSSALQISLHHSFEASWLDSFQQSLVILDGLIEISRQPLKQAPQKLDAVYQTPCITCGRDRAKPAVAGQVKSDVRQLTASTYNPT
jgi:hypothetical protein